MAQVRGSQADLPADRFNVQSAQALFPAAVNSPVLSVLSPIADYGDRLEATERPAVARAVAKRQREFATGRVLARAVMQALALPAAPIPQGPDRAPKWPAGMRGSISHTDLLAWVVAAPSQSLRNVGADLERLDRLDSDLHVKLFTANESRRLSQSNPNLATLLFSAKEAVYKATQPLAGAFIGFLEVEILPSADASQFSVRYLGSHEPSRIMEQGRGYLCLHQAHALALFVVPSVSDLG